MTLEDVTPAANLTSWHSGLFVRQLSVFVPPGLEARLPLLFKKMFPLSSRPMHTLQGGGGWGGG
jgi:hypothetical protein